MKKNYAANTFFFTLAIICLLAPKLVSGQAPRVFTIEDFELKGKVRFCEVIADYGKETFEFNESGFLTKNITRFNEQDYDVTYYKYQGDELAERRDEVYRDGTFDKNISLAHLYTLDTTVRKKITEKIVSYNEEFLEQYEYEYDLEDKLIKVVRSNNDGLDETLVRYTIYKSESTVSNYLNGVVQKTVRTSTKKKKNGNKRKIELIKDFLEGIPNKAIEKTYNAKDRLIAEQNFVFNSVKKSFEPTSFITYKYDTQGMLTGMFTKVEGTVLEKEFIYQFDSEESGNWVKKIVTPENSYTTRRIEYYTLPEVEIEE